MADNTDEIARIRALLASGVKSVTVDGITTTLDLDSLRRELRRLIATDDALRGSRPVASSIDLSGF